VVEDIVGDEKPVLAVTGVRVRNIKTDKVQTIPASGIFVAIGHDPATKIFRGQLHMDAEGYITGKPDSTATSVPGVYAAGDVKDKIFRQAVTAAGMGCMAALEAEKFLAAHENPAHSMKVAS
jgi:thioredoxin reductase (NADPH)